MNRSQQFISGFEKEVITEAHESDPVDVAMEKAKAGFIRRLSFIYAGSDYVKVYEALQAAKTSPSETNTEAFARILGVKLTSNEETKADTKGHPGPEVQKQEGAGKRLRKSRKG